MRKIDFKSFVKRCLRTNYVVRLVKNYFSTIIKDADKPYGKLVSLMEEHGIDTILDIGANVGQFGIDIRSAGFKGELISYEPAREAFISLQRTAGKFPFWRVVNLGLGDVESTRFIFIAGNDGLSSSFLKMNDLHLMNFPESQFVGSELIGVSTIDLEIIKLELNAKRVLLKIDAQGFEANILKGAVLNLREIPICFLELSLYPLYEGEESYLDVLNFMNSFGHRVNEMYRGTRDKRGNLLQIDVITENGS